MNEKEVSEKIKNNLSIDQVKDLLYSLGGNPIVKGEMIMSQTICHAGHSHKLYYYNNTKLFRCYTNCGDAFDIFDLVLKVKEVDGIKWVLPQAVNFIINFYGLTIQTENSFFSQEELEDWKVLNKYEQSNSQEKEEKIVEFKFFDDKILKHLPRPKILPWLKEGITQEAMDRSGICYDPVQQGIVIPHYNIDGRLIGIRERTLIKENESNGKYKPAILNYQMYNHPLGFNLYNLNNSKDNIKQMKKAFIFESEKSCLKYISYFGAENDISVAVCGSSLTFYQVELLLGLGIEEMIIAFDREGENDDKKSYVKKFYQLYNKFGAVVQMSFLYDINGTLLDYKSSPIDHGPEVFLKLFNNRIYLNGQSKGD